MSTPPESREEAIARLQKSASDLEARTAPKSQDYGAQAAGYGYRLMAEMIGGVLVGLAAGWGVDFILRSAPWGMIVGTLLGFAVSVWLAVRSAKALSARALREFGPPQDLPDEPDEDDDDTQPIR